MSNQRIAVIGGGPAGSTLAVQLARAGRRVCLIRIGKRPELIVGESLLPAVVPMLRELGVEQEVSSYGVFKPGATVGLQKHESLCFDFERAGGDLPAYAYNVPRDRFDQTLLDAAQRSGVEVITDKAQVCVGDDGRPRLQSCAAAVTELLGGEPDVLVDATGRARLFSRAMALEEERGDRRDTALFAHYDRAELHRPGDIHVDRLEHGWSWRIPLRGRVSVGVVVDPRHLCADGQSSAEQLDSLLATEPRLRSLMHGATRLTPVVRYSNYQLLTTRLFGPGWALCGDAAGFVDPIFSTGLYLAMRGAFDLAAALLEGPPAMLPWQERWLTELRTWRRIISHWYDGRLFAAFRVGRGIGGSPIGGTWIARQLDGHATRHMTRIFTGEAGQGSYSRQLLEVLVPLGVAGARRLQVH